jgi:prephenate dehydrogenase
MKGSMKSRSISIFGPGLLGGSLVKAWRKLKPQWKLFLWARREEMVQQLLAEGAVDAASTDAVAMVAEADLVVLATPVETMAEQARAMLPGLRPGTLITDVGSVKGKLVKELEAIFARAGAHFVGSHPMAGKEKAGWESADEGIFPGATCIVTPTPNSNTAAVEEISDLWVELGMKVLPMSPEEHDRKIARVSHMPHVVSAAVAWAALQADSSAALCVGNGFRDMTRIARGHDGLWTGILSENQAEVVQAVTDVRDRLTELVAILQRMDKEELRQYLTDAAHLLQHVPVASLR